MDRKTSRALRPIALAFAALLAGCATSSAPQRAAERGPAPRADRQIEAQASAFESFMRKARGIAPAFSGPSAVAEALKAGAAYDPRQMEAGLVAYAAVAALREPRFAEAVRKSADRRGLARRLAARPDLALALPGAEAAAARASGALYRQGAALAESGQGVKKASYSVQRQAWSKAFVPDARGRLTRVKQISAAGYRPDGGDPARLYDAVSEGGRRGGAASPVVARGVALAALTVLGEPAPRSLMSEPRAGMCLRLAKLNLYQCLASAGPYYEDIYCLGQHAMMETASCVQEATRPARRPAA